MVVVVEVVVELLVGALELVVVAIKGGKTRRGKEVREKKMFMMTKGIG